MSRLSVLSMRLPLAALALCAAAGFIAVSPCVSPVRRAQEADSVAPAFEVASIKLAGPIPPGRVWGFELTADTFPRGLFSVSGRRVEVHAKTAAQLVAAAYLIPAREIVGPSWMSDTRFDIDAVMPAGQSPDKAAEMLRTLLEVRFALKAHHEVRRMSGYILSIGKGGPKLTETGPDVPTNDPMNYVRRIKPGFNGKQMDHCDMLQLILELAHDLRVPVEDQTGLKGHYSIVIQYRYDDWADESGRPAILVDAMSDYGLHLVTGKVDAPVLVIDNMSKTPTEN